MLLAREYRYTSPTFRASKDGEIEELLNVALTNTPATKRMTPLMASQLDGHTETEEVQMEQLLALLGLTANATEAEAIAKVQALMASTESVAQLSTLTGKTGAEMLGIVQAWKVSTERVTELSARVAELETEKLGTELAAVIASAKAAKKVTPAMEPHLLSLGKQSLVSLKAFIEALPAVVGETKTEAKADASATSLSGGDAQVISMLGVDPAKFEARRKAHGGVIPTVTNE
jgi:phage I-like protein